MLPEVKAVHERIIQIPIFSCLRDDSDALNRLISFMAKVQFAAGDAIISEGEHGSEMYVLNKGRIRIEKKTLQNDTFTVVILNDAMNIIFGEQALLDSDQRSATVIPETDVECFVIAKEDFERFADAFPVAGLRITREIAKILSQRLRKANQDINTLFEALVSEIETGG